MHCSPPPSQRCKGENPSSLLALRFQVSRVKGPTFDESQMPNITLHPLLTRSVSGEGLTVCDCTCVPAPEPTPAPLSSLLSDSFMPHSRAIPCLSPHRPHLLRSDSACGAGASGLGLYMPYACAPVHLRAVGPFSPQSLT